MMIKNNYNPKVSYDSYICIVPTQHLFRNYTSVILQTCNGKCDISEIELKQRLPLTVSVSLHQALGRLQSLWPHYKQKKESAAMFFLWLWFTDVTLHSICSESFPTLRRPVGVLSRCPREGAVDDGTTSQRLERGGCVCARCKHRHTHTPSRRHVFCQALNRHLFTRGRTHWDTRTHTHTPIIA